MSVNITIAGVSYPEPSNAADTNWAAQQLAVIQALAASASYAVRRLSVNTTPVGNGANTTEDTLMTYTIPAGTFTASGQGVRITAAGAGVSTADATTLRMYIGGGPTLVLSKVLTASQANGWRVVYEMVVSGPLSDNAEVGTGALVNGGTTPGSGTTTLVSTETDLTEDPTGSILIKFTGQRASTSVANSVTQSLLLVEFLP